MRSESSDGRIVPEAWRKPGDRKAAIVSGLGKATGEGWREEKGGEMSKGVEEEQFHE
jgi:hypothetical protein